MMRLVTGSSGQIGSYAMELLGGEGQGAARGLDLVDSPPTTHVGDIRDPDTVDAALDGCSTVIHCAAQVSVAASLEHPAEDASHNILGTVNLLDRARQAGEVDRFVFVSSAAVYGEPVKVPISEDHPLVPSSPYGTSKLAGERYVRMFEDLYGIECVIARPFNAYSPRQDPSSPYSGVIAVFARALGNGENPVIHGKGDQTRDFIHAFDVARVLCLLAEEENVPARTFNVGVGAETSVRDLAEIMIELGGNQRIEPRFAEPRPGDIHRSVAEISRLEAIGFEPAITLEAGLRGVLEGREPHDLST